MLHDTGRAQAQAVGSSLLLSQIKAWALTP